MPMGNNDLRSAGIAAVVAGTFTITVTGASS